MQAKFQLLTRDSAIGGDLQMAFTHWQALHNPVTCYTYILCPNQLMLTKNCLCPSDDVICRGRYLPSSINPPLFTRELFCQHFTTEGLHKILLSLQYNSLQVILHYEHNNIVQFTVEKLTVYTMLLYRTVVYSVHCTLLLQCKNCTSIYFL